MEYSSPFAPIPAALPERDFPASCAHLYRQDFLYPEGYLPKSNRVTCKDTLLRFEDWLRPYVIRSANGEACVDGSSPVPVLRLPNLLPDRSVNSLVRFIEVGGPPDDSMQETYKVEDAIEEAAILAKIGRYLDAISLLCKIPKPFQKEPQYLEILVRSLLALGRYSEALLEIRHLANAKDITEYARGLHRITTANLLLHTGEAKQAEALLSEWRDQLDDKWSYYGARAALALYSGDRCLAKCLILKAGRADPYHAYKLLWNRHLVPLAPFIRHELLTETGKPRLYRLNTDVRQICHKVHGALLTGNVSYAQNLSEGLNVRHVTDWSCAHQYVLALLGLGYFDRATKSIGVLPGAGTRELELACHVCHFVTNDKVSTAEIDKLAQNEKLFAKADARVLLQALPLLRKVKTEPLPELQSSILGGIASLRWEDWGREHYILIYTATLGFEARKVIESPKIRSYTTLSLDKSAQVIESVNFSCRSDFELWIEDKLQYNHRNPGPFEQGCWSIKLNGWGCLGILQPNSKKTPLLAGVLERATHDPDLYFASGPAGSRGLSLPFGNKLVYMLRTWLRNRRNNLE